MQEICLGNFSPNKLTTDRPCSKWTMGDFNHVFLKVSAILIILSLSEPTLESLARPLVLI